MFAPILAILIKIIVIAFVFSVLILAHELGHFMAARRSGVRVRRFSLGFGPEIVGFQRGHTRYSISAIPFGGYIKMAGEDPREELLGQPWEYLSQPVGRRLAIVGAGPISNYLLAFLLFFFILVIGEPIPTSRIGGLLEDFPAKAHGLKVGDRIVAIDGEPVSYWSQMAETIHRRIEGDLDLTIEREGRTFHLIILPKVEERLNIWGKIEKVALLGITPSDEVAKLRHNPWESFYSSGNKILILTALTYKGIWWLVTGKMPFTKAVAGPIGIASIVGKAAGLGLVYIFQLMAILSVALAIFNLLPFPILDGGSIFFLALEKVRGRPLSTRVQEGIQQVAFALLILLVLFVSYSDIMRLVTE